MSVPSVLGAMVLSACADTDFAPKVTYGQKVVGVMNFPVWTMSVIENGSRKEIGIPAGLVQAKYKSSAHTEELLLAVLSGDGMPSTQHYAISTDGQFTLREASTPEWMMGDSLTVRQVSGAPVQVSDANLYHYSGQSLKWAVQSPDARATAIVSTTVTERPKGGIFISLPGSGRWRGKLYMELFDTSTHSRLGAIEMNYLGTDGIEPSWIGSRAFVLPLDAYEQTWLIALSSVP